MDISLFSEMARIPARPAHFAEPEFTYLDTSARIECMWIRKLLDEWFSRYPAEARSTLRSAFRSEDDGKHRSAFFELYLHELLLRLGCCVQVHPSLPGTTRKPDFLVMSGQDRFYVEAIATSVPPPAAAAQAIKDVVYDAINAMGSPHFWLGVKEHGAPRTASSITGLCRLLNKRLAALDPDALAPVYADHGPAAMPLWSYEHEGWYMKFFPIPKPPHRRGLSGGRVIAMQFGGVVADRSDDVIRQAVLGKAGQYGELDQPYVIAVNVFQRVDATAIVNALFGESQWPVAMTGSGLQVGSPVRVPEGAWVKHAGPRYQRVSASFIAVRLSPWNLTTAGVRLYHNPWARRPLASPLDRLPHAVASGDYLEFVEGESLGDIFGLSPGWPELEGTESS